jgi:hypothetical protein
MMRARKGERKVSQKFYPNPLLATCSGAHRRHQQLAVLHQLKVERGKQRAHIAFPATQRTRCPRQQRRKLRVILQLQPMAINRSEQTGSIALNTSPN